jgi:hypothetical protein
LDFQPRLEFPAPVFNGASMQLATLREIAWKYRNISNEN